MFMQMLESDSTARVLAATRMALWIQGRARGLRALKRTLAMKRALSTIARQLQRRVRAINAQSSRRALDAKTSVALWAQRRARRRIAGTRSEELRDAELLVASWLQARVRGYRARATSHSSREIEACVRVQATWRSRAARRELRRSVAARRVQCAWRVHRACWNFFLRLGAVVSIQRRARGGRLGRASLQNVARSFVDEARKERARYAIGRAMRSSRLLATMRRRRFFGAIEAVQAAARSVSVRRQTRDMAARRRRLAALAAEARADPGRVLGNRTIAALDVLRTSSKLTDIIKACTELEISTRLSVSCCERFVAARAPLVLYRLMRTCNRSKPHLELIAIALAVLANITRHDALCAAVCPSTAHCDVLLTLLLHVVREVDDSFQLALRVLRRVCGAVAAHRAHCNAPDTAKRLAGAVQLLRLRGRKIQANALAAFVRANNPLGASHPNVSRG